MFAEALFERARPHASGEDPTELQLLQMATSSGLASLGLDDRLMVGKPANMIAVNAAMAFYDQLPQSPEELAALTLRAGQSSRNIERVYVGGRHLKGNR